MSDAPSSFAFHYGTLPDAEKEYNPRLFVIDGVATGLGDELIDISPWVNHNSIGDIQSVIFSTRQIGAAQFYRFIFGITGVTFYIQNAFNAAQCGLAIFPYMSPRDCRQHYINTNGMTVPYQLVFTNIALPLLGGINS